MSFAELPMILGFLLAAYSVVGNDVIQTLGTFLSSNEKRPWYVLWAFAASILSAVLIFGWANGDIDYGRLDKIDIPETLSWWFVLPPLVLMFITRFGIPVSTTFLILTFFSPKALNPMVIKSVTGYLVAFGTGAFVYYLISSITERRFAEKQLGADNSFWNNKQFWTIAQWFATGFLWWQWLTQDLANIYVYLLAGAGGTGNIDALTFFLSLFAILLLLAYTFYAKGGAIQNIVKRKNNTDDIRSATFIDLIYGVILYLFKYNALGLWEGKIPMSTTWVFLGLLAGRELFMRLRLEGKVLKEDWKDIGLDLIKVFSGLVISILLVYIMRLAQGQPFFSV